MNAMKKLLSGIKEMGRTARAIGRLGLIAGVLVTHLPLQYLYYGPVKKDYMTVSQKMMKALTRILGIKVAFNGAATEQDRPAVFVTNHMSWMDPFIMAERVKGSFLGKYSAKDIPVIGKISQQFKTIFIKRTPEYKPQAIEDVVKNFNEGRNLMYFPEGTVTDGTNVLQFKAGLMSVLFNRVAKNMKGEEVRLDKDVVMQPFAMKLTHVDGKSVEEDYSLRARFCLPGIRFDERGQIIAEDKKKEKDDGTKVLLKHVWQTLKTKSMRLELTGFEPMDPKDYANQYDFMNEARRRVAEVIAPDMPEPQPHKIPVEDIELTTEPANENRPNGPDKRGLGHY